MIERIRNTAFRAARIDRIAQLKTIVADYPGQRLTSRQVYYQFVARGLIENTERSYKLTTKLITDARYAGELDWEVIEDRGREPMVPSEWEGLPQLVDSALRGYRRPRWDSQPCYLELWVEKQALAGVLAPIAHQRHVTLMVNKGYSSASAMKDSASRMLAFGGAREKVIAYLGDHDPSGEDMVRDIGDRAREFGVTNLQVVKLGLTIAQVHRLKLPPNPAKITDSRAAAYIAKYGPQSWELDALPPDELTSMVDTFITSMIDAELMAEVVAQENRDKARLRAAVQNIMEAA